MAPRPTLDPAGLRLVDPVLTNLALAYRPEGFIYDQVVSRMDVSLDGGLYPVWSREDLLRDDVDSEVDYRSETPEIDATYDLRAYLLRQFRLKVSIAPDERGQSHQALRLEQTKLNLLLDRMAMRRERRLAAKLRKTTNGGSLILGGGISTKWDANSGATIEKDIKGAHKAVYDATGQHVDTIVMTWDVAYAIALDPAIREIVKYTVDGQAIIRDGEKLLPQVLHGLRVVIADGNKVNVGRKGAAANYQDVWGDNVRLIKRVADNEWGKPATVYNLVGEVLPTEESSSRRTAPAGEAQRFLVDRWAEADPPVDYIRAWEKGDEHVVAADIGYEITDVLTG